MKHADNSRKSDGRSTPRRSFLVRLAVAVTGGLVGLFPFAVGLGVITDPLRRKKGGAGDADGPELVRIGPLDLLPDDGIPRQFPLSADVVDAWTRSPAQRVGTVFLCRTASSNGPKITAFTSICPHLGCAVDFIAKAGRFECPCHASAFAKDGKKLFGPSLRGLDPLKVQVLDAGEGPEIWVAFERFRTGLAERVPVA